MNKKLSQYTHHFECSTENFFSKKTKLHFQTFEDFYAEFADADVNMNLIFRFDVKTKDDGTNYCEVFMIQQRKGIFLPIRIEAFTETDEADFRELLKAHWQYLKDIWSPISAD